MDRRDVKLTLRLYDEEDKILRECAEKTGLVSRQDVLRAFIWREAKLGITDRLESRKGEVNA